VPYRFAPLPTATELRAKRDELLVAKLTRAEDPEVDEAPLDEAEAAHDAEVRARIATLAERLAGSGDVRRVIAHLLTTTGLADGPDPRELRVLHPPVERGAKARVAERPTSRRDDWAERPSYPRRDSSFERAPGFEPAPRRGRRDEIGAEPAWGSGPDHGHAPRTVPPSRGGEPTRWVPVHVTWGQLHGADPRRMLAMLCRRGGIVSSDIGAIDVGRTSSTVQVAEAVAERFLELASRPDPRDPKIAIRPAESPSRASASRGQAPDDEAPTTRRAVSDEAPHDAGPPRRPRRSFGDAPAPRPKRSFDDAPAPRPKRSFGDAPAARPKRSFDDAPAARPKRSFDDAPAPKPKRSFDDAPAPKPKRSFGTGGGHAPTRPARPAPSKKRFTR
jgi:ATP-dependent RNA helicase DeaD